MRFARFLGLVLTGSACLCAEPEIVGAPGLTPKEEILEELFAERESRQALDQTIEAARKKGVTEQAILEARFLFHVDRSEEAEIAGMLPQLLVQKKRFRLEDSEIFACEDDWLAVLEYAHAMAALQKGDKAGFKSHITEAFWLSPRQGIAFAPHIERLRLMDAMKDVKLDLAKKYRHTLDEGSSSLEDILNGKKGALIHFWSPRSPECEGTLADFFITSEALLARELGVVSVLVGPSPEADQEAKVMLEATKKKIVGRWITDSGKSPMSAQLRVYQAPAVVLLDKDAKILFNGHPTSDEFWNLLEKMIPDFKRPAMEAE